MYRPTMSQFLVFLANSFKELQDNNVLLLYVSADGVREPAIEGKELNLCKRGGVALNSRRSPEKQDTGISADCLYPEDLTIYTRKHLFLIIESDNSGAFDVSCCKLFLHKICQFLTLFSEYTNYIWKTSYVSIISKTYPKT